MTAAIENSPALGSESRADQDKFYRGLQESESRFHELLSAFAAGDQVLELRSGNDSVAEVLTARGVDVTTVDADEALAFDNRSFDGIVGIGVLYRLDMVRAFSETSRVLRSDGRAVFIEPLGHNPLVNGYRRRTPAARQAYTHPLRCEDLVLAGRFFVDVDVETFHLFGGLSSALADHRLGRLVHRFVGRLDRALIRVVPRLRWHAWIAVTELRRPQ